MMTIQQTIEKLLRATKRERVEELLTVMRNNGYYRVGCHGHHRWQGGLAQRSMEVLLYMQRHNTNADIPASSIVIAALLHDLHNIRGYKQYRHHGSRSVLITTREIGFKLTNMEYQAILWHAHGKSEKGTLGASFDAVLTNPLWQLLRKADYYTATHPMTKADLLFAMNDEQRCEKRELVRSRDCDYTTVRPSGVLSLGCLTTKPKPEITPEEKHRRDIRKNSVSVAEVLAALKAFGVEIPEETQAAVADQFNQTTAENNKCFMPDYKDPKSPLHEKLEEHRTMLYDLCQRRRNAANLVAEYIYQTAQGVFDIHYDTKETYEWLKQEFGFTASLESFYKARPKFDHYRGFAAG